LAWDLAREEARAAGADEALLVSPAGELLEGAASNVFVVRDGVVCTPPLASDVLPGITRALVLECCAALGVEARQAPMHRDLLGPADEIFVTNSVQEVLPLERDGEQELAASRVGRALLEAGSC